METVIFYLFFGICFICFSLRTTHHLLKNRGNELAESGKVIKALYFVMFFLWTSWVGMAIGDLYEMNLADWVRYTGLAVFIVGVLFFIIAHVKIMGVESQGLATGGIYSRLRHPMYYGFILWIIGLPIFMNALFTLASAAIWIPQLLYWGRSEEKELEEKYEGYEAYKKKTWF